MPSANPYPEEALNIGPSPEPEVWEDVSRLQFEKLMPFIQAAGGKVETNIHGTCLFWLGTSQRGTHQVPRLVGALTKSAASGRIMPSAFK